MLFLFFCYRFSVNKVLCRPIGLSSHRKDGRTDRQTEGQIAMQNALLIRSRHSAVCSIDWLIDCLTCTSYELIVTWRVLWWRVSRCRTQPRPEHQWVVQATHVTSWWKFTITTRTESPVGRPFCLLSHSYGTGTATLLCTITLSTLTCEHWTVFFSEWYHFKSARYMRTFWAVYIT